MSLNTMVDETIEKRLQGLFGPTLDKTPPAYLKRNVMDAIGKIADKRFAGHSRRVVMKGNFFAMAADDGESIALEMDDQASQVTLRLWSMRGSTDKYLLELTTSCSSLRKPYGHYAFGWSGGRAWFGATRPYGTGSLPW